MTLFLVRHGSALDRTQWSSDDLDRPLDERGRLQAEAITTFFAGRPVRGVWSSQAARCHETVAPTARAHGLAVQTRRELTEGARPELLLEVLRAEATHDDDLVMASHGDLIPEVLNRLALEGMRVGGSRGCKKGSIWALDTRGHAITAATYTARP